MKCPKCGNKMYLINPIWHCCYCSYAGNPDIEISTSDHTEIIKKDETK